MVRRINVVLPEATVRTIDRLSGRRQRSRFIDRAVQHFVHTAGPEALRERLRVATLRDRDLDLATMGDWLAVDEEQWQNIGTRADRQVAGQKEEKSSSSRSTRQLGMKSKRHGLH